MEKQAMQKLTVWNFYISSNFVKPFLYRVPKLFLGDKNKMDNAMYKNFEQEQVEQYYTQKVMKKEEIKPLYEI